MQLPLRFVIVQLLPLVSLKWPPFFLIIFVYFDLDKSYLDFKITRVGEELDFHSCGTTPDSVASKLKECVAGTIALAFRTGFMNLEYCKVAWYLHIRLEMCTPCTNLMFNFAPNFSLRWSHFCLLIRMCYLLVDITGSNSE